MNDANNRQNQEHFRVQVNLLSNSQPLHKFSVELNYHCQTVSCFKSVTQPKHNSMYKCYVFACHLLFCDELQMQPRRCCLTKCFVQHDTPIISECQGKDAEPQHDLGLLVHSPTVWKQYYHNWLNRKTHTSVVSHWRSDCKQTAACFLGGVNQLFFLSSVSLFNKKKRKCINIEKQEWAALSAGKMGKNFLFFFKGMKWDTGWSISRAVSQTHNLCHQSRCVIIARRSESRFQQAGIMKRLHTHTHTLPSAKWPFSTAVHSITIENIFVCFVFFCLSFCLYMCFNIATTQRPNRWKSSETNADAVAKLSCQSTIKPTLNIVLCEFWTVCCRCSDTLESSRLFCRGPRWQTDESPTRGQMGFEIFMPRRSVFALPTKNSRVKSWCRWLSCGASASRRTLARCVCLLVWFVIKGV